MSNSNNNNNNNYNNNYNNNNSNSNNIPSRRPSSPIKNKINGSTNQNQNFPNNKEALNYANYILNKHTGLLTSNLNHTKKFKLDQNRKYINLLKKLRILFLDKLVKNTRTKKNMNTLIKSYYEDFFIRIENIVLGLYYMEYKSEVANEYRYAFSIDLDEVYDVIKNSLYKSTEPGDDIEDIELFVIYSYLQLIYGKSKSDEFLKERAKFLLDEEIETVTGSTLTYSLDLEYEGAIDNIRIETRGLLSRYNKPNMLFSFDNDEPIDLQVKQVMTYLIETYYDNDRSLRAKINTMKIVDYDTFRQIVASYKPPSKRPNNPKRISKNTELFNSNFSETTKISTIPTKKRVYINKNSNVKNTGELRRVYNKNAMNRFMANRHEGRLHGNIFTIRNIKEITARNTVNKNVYLRNIKNRLMNSTLNNLNDTMNKIKKNLPSNISHTEVNTMARSMKPQILNKIYNKLRNSPANTRARLMNSFKSKGLMNNNDIVVLTKKLM